MLVPKIKIVGDKRTHDRLKKYSRVMRDKKAMKKIWQALAGYMLNEYHKNFKNKGRDSGGWKRISAWAALIRRNAKSKPKTMADAEAIAAKAYPLIDTARLRDSLRPNKQGSKYMPGADKGQITNIKNMGVEIGTNVPYARHHQEGGRWPFKFDEQMDALLKKNISPSDGSKKKKKKSSKAKGIKKTKKAKKTTTTGIKKPKKARKKRKKRDATSNPLYWKVKALLQKKKVVDLPKREIIYQPHTKQKKRMINVMVLGLKKKWSELFGK